MRELYGGLLPQMAQSLKSATDETLQTFLSNHFQDKKIPVHESLVTQCCPGIGMVVLIE
jgi:hypothetical protein